MKLAGLALLPVFALGLVLATGQTASAADAEEGEFLFRTTCASCHSLEQGSHRTGPSLYKIWGSPAGAAEGFDYSDAFKTANAEGLTWTAEILDKFVKRPRSVVRKNKMAYLGLRDDAERADLLEYLKKISE